MVDISDSEEELMDVSEPDLSDSNDHQDNLKEQEEEIDYEVGGDSL